MTGPDTQRHRLREHLLAIPAPQLEERLARLDRLANMGTLAAVMAHEIKNALVAGKTFMDLLLEKHHDAELADVVRREMDRIDAIVSGMLKFGGPARSGFCEVRLHDILDHSLRLVQPQLDNKGIALTRSFRAVPDVMQGNDYQLQQAFVNLFLNAFEAMEPNGTLSVTTDLLHQPAIAAGRRLRQAGPAAGDHQRQRRRNFPRTHGAPLRAFFHHQAQRHRLGPAHHAAHYPGTPWRHHRRKPARPRGRVPHRLAGAALTAPSSLLQLRPCASARATLKRPARSLPLPPAPSERLRRFRPAPIFGIGLEPEGEGDRDVLRGGGIVAHDEGEGGGPASQVAVDRIVLFLHGAGAGLEPLRRADPQFSLSRNRKLLVKRLSPVPRAVGEELKSSRT